MPRAEYDVVVVGAGPAGSVAALVLARGGATVALVDKASFPRDKACGDLVGPRGLELCKSLGVHLPAGRSLGPMEVIGPTGNAVVLPAIAGRTYPGRGLAIRRRVLDDALRTAAIEAGATAFTARVKGMDMAGNQARRVLLAPVAGGETGTESFLRCGAVVGADGATTQAGLAARLVAPDEALWAFAIRGYAPMPLEIPHIVLWEPAPRRLFGGYGWAFPGDGEANVGLGAGLGHSRAGAATVSRQLEAFLAHLTRIGLTGLDGPVRTMGGWLKMGMVGTVPASGNVLLAGDAAGLVNPLQGEGISQALRSGRAAGEAILAGTEGAARRYLGWLRSSELPYNRSSAPLHAAALGSARRLSLAARLLTMPPIGSSVAGVWGMYWNNLIDGAAPSGARRGAAGVQHLVSHATTWTTTAKWLDGGSLELDR
ncbi:MAG: geranylgeranyl reductase family protein [Acidimicrobiales bacterium]